MGQKDLYLGLLRGFRSGFTRCGKGDGIGVAERPDETMMYEAQSGSMGRW